ncbi:hypothetical protein JCM6882_001304 [Rhodosporidiobolus microsporus]
MSASSSPSKKQRPSLSDEFKTVSVRTAHPTAAKPEWEELSAKEEEEDYEHRLFSLPGNVLDQILSDPSLNLRDHLSLAATCRTLRACYYTRLPSDHSQPDSPLWNGLMALRCTPQNGQRKAANGACTAQEAATVDKIWTGRKVDPLEMEVVGRMPDSVQLPGSKKRQLGPFNGWEGKAVRSYGWERAILVVHAAKLTKTDSKNIYKISDKELDMLSRVVKRNPRAPKTGSIYLFTEAAVESLALRLHGGERGHQEHLAVRAARNKRAADTRARNASTSASSTPRSLGGLLASSSSSSSSAPYPSSSPPRSAPGPAYNASSSAVHDALVSQFGMTGEQAKVFAQYEEMLARMEAEYEDGEEGYEGEWEGDECGGWY